MSTLDVAARYIAPVPPNRVLLRRISSSFSSPGQSRLYTGRRRSAPLPLPSSTLLVSWVMLAGAYVWHLKEDGYRESYG